MIKLRTDEYLRGWYWGVKWAAEMIKKGKVSTEDIIRLHPEYYKEPEEWKTEKQWKEEDVWGEVI